MKKKITIEYHGRTAYDEIQSDGVSEFGDLWQDVMLALSATFTPLMDTKDPAVREMLARSARVVLRETKRSNQALAKRAKDAGVKFKFEAEPNQMVLRVPKR